MLWASFIPCDHQLHCAFRLCVRKKTGRYEESELILPPISQTILSVLNMFSQLEIIHDTPFNLSVSEQAKAEFLYSLAFLFLPWVGAVLVNDSPVARFNYCENLCCQTQSIWQALLNYMSVSHRHTVAVAFYDGVVHRKKYIHKYIRLQWKCVMSSLYPLVRNSHFTMKSCLMKIDR